MLAAGYVGAVKSQQRRDFGQLLGEMSALGERLAGPALDPHRRRETGREGAGDVVDDVVADHSDLARVELEHRDGARVRVGIGLADADLLRDRDRVDLVLDLDQVDRADAGVRVRRVELVVELAPRLEPVADVVAAIRVEVDVPAEEELVVAVGELVGARLELLGIEGRIALGEALRHGGPELPPPDVVVDEREVEIEENAADRHGALTLAAVLPSRYSGISLSRPVRCGTTRQGVTNMTKKHRTLGVAV